MEVNEFLRGMPGAQLFRSNAIINFIVLKSSVLLPWCMYVSNVFLFLGSLNIHSFVAEVVAAISFFLHILNRQKEEQRHW